MAPLLHRAAIINRSAASTQSDRQTPI